MGVCSVNKTELTNVSCVYTGGNIYVYQAMYKGHWIYGGLDSWMDAYSYEPFRYQEETDSSEAPEAYRIDTDDFPTWRDIAESLRQPDATIFGDVDECIDIIECFGDLDTKVNVME